MKVSNQHQINIPDKCLYCGKTFRKKDSDLINESGDSFAFHLTCKHCHTSFIIHLIVGKEGVLSIGTATDASKEDLEKLRKGQNVTADDVIEAYVHLKKVMRSA